jgi:dTDP-4-dehydrorhamnose reductase
MKTLVYGRNGWLAKQVAGEFDGLVSVVDIMDVRGVESQLADYKPDVVVNCAGKTGRPNIDWCELTPENMRLTEYANTYGPVVLYDACRRAGVKLVHISSGCLWGHGEDVREDDDPAPVSYYSETKARGDELLGGNDSEAIIVRIRMPIDGVPNCRNLITKLAGYPSVLSVSNSVTVIEDLVKAIRHLVEIDARGIYNVVNTGPLTGRDVIESYMRHVDPAHECEIIDEEEFVRRGLTKAERSNCTLSNRKLAESGFEMPAAAERLEACMRAYAAAGG